MGLVDRESIRQRTNIHSAKDTHSGIVSLSLQCLFDQIDKGQCWGEGEGEGEGDVEQGECTVSMSFLQIYLDRVHDLFDKGAVPLAVREDTTGFYVSGLTSRTVTSAPEALQALEEGLLNRAMAPTLMNATSSRSHTVLMVSVGREGVRTVHVDEGGDVQVPTTTQATLTLVDLAGSERVKRSQSRGIRLEEARRINQSLSALGSVISALTEPGTKHIPFRNSKLTRLLQNSLSGNCRTCVIATVCPETASLSETISTLAFAKRCKLVETVPIPQVKLVETVPIPQVKSNDTAALVAALEAQLQALKSSNAEEMQMLRRSLPAKKGRREGERERERLGGSSSGSTDRERERDKERESTVRGSPSARWGASTLSTPESAAPCPSLMFTPTAASLSLLYGCLGEVSDEAVQSMPAACAPVPPLTLDTTAIGGGEGKDTSRIVYEAILKGEGERENSSNRRGGVSPSKRERESRRKRGRQPKDATCASACASAMGSGESVLSLLGMLSDSVSREEYQLRQRAVDVAASVVAGCQRERDLLHWGLCMRHVLGENKVLKQKMASQQRYGLLSLDAAHTSDESYTASDVDTSGLSEDGERGRERGGYSMDTGRFPYDRERERERGRGVVVNMPPGRGSTVSNTNSLYRQRYSVGSLGPWSRPTTRTVTQGAVSLVGRGGVGVGEPSESEWSSVGDPHNAQPVQGYLPTYSPDPYTLGRPAGREREGGRPGSLHSARQSAAWASLSAQPSRASVLPAFPQPHPAATSTSGPLPIVRTSSVIHTPPQGEQQYGAGTMGQESERERERERVYGRMGMASTSSQDALDGSGVYVGEREREGAGYNATAVHNPMPHPIAYQQETHSPSSSPPPSPIAVSIPVRASAPPGTRSSAPHFTRRSVQPLKGRALSMEPIVPQRESVTQSRVVVPKPTPLDVSASSSYDSESESESVSDVRGGGQLDRFLRAGKR
ncbi:kinesin-like protein [Kipferlia bialata]|uniref:Kinesin-like protein n=1 Tax=Kipferlia bialata TaxID=797122 RepID=A0A9K3CNQ1_9EUKA|nr:kinesin-like protein [Kipferlia bialata]|eukprot:g225.t1